MWKLKNKINQQAEEKQIHIDTEGFRQLSEERGVGEWVVNVKGLVSTNWWLQSSHGDIAYSMRNDAL